MSAMEMPIRGKCKGKMSSGVADKEQVESLQQSVIALKREF